MDSNEERQDPNLLAIMRAEPLTLWVFALEVAARQVSEGRRFAIEQPQSAHSLRLCGTEWLWRQEGFREVTIDMCRFGLRISGEELTKKPTTIITNDLSSLQVLSKKKKS